MKKKTLMVGGFLVALCAVTAAFALRGATSEFMSFKAVKTTPGTAQILGKLDKSSIQMTRDMKQVTFKLLERDAKSGRTADKETFTGEEITVFYNNPNDPVQATFGNAVDVRAVGAWDAANNRFVAERLFTKCPSKEMENGKLDDGKGNGQPKFPLPAPANGK